MLIHPTKQGYRNNKHKMKNMNTTLELPEGSKATIQGKVIDGKVLATGALNIVGV